MSAPSAHNDNISPDSDAGSTLLSAIERLDEHTLTTPLQMAAFWTAIALPFFHLRLLLGGLSSSAETTTFLWLLALNLVALVIGHSYNAE
ncbi:hypothetical protein G9464_20130 [Halostella sp. JP-L12]|uniref:hypothetical protein n=1 Tax=Halostella TaxID=1843185 RepID=UPI000EF79005|nr:MULTISPECIES: hypothetical protein [Halostella]NHN49880.1 hypothetical protein [Halostella sp. JP-L12]